MADSVVSSRLDRRVPGHQPAYRTCVSNAEARPSRRPPSPAAQAFARRYDVQPGSLATLGAFEAEVCTAQGPHGPVILKVHDPRHRTPDQVQAEVDWVRTLRASGVAVARPLRSRAGAWVECDGDPPHVAVAYERVPGRHLAPREWTPAWIERHGALLGSLHAHARTAAHPSAHRPNWLEVDVCHRAAEAFPGDDAMIEASSEAFHRATDVLGSAADGAAEDVGTIHTDLHPGNMLADDDGTLTAIDFDDLAVGPYLHDLAMVLYYAFALRRDQPAADVVPAFMAPFKRGFEAHAPWPAGSAEAVAALLTLRQVNLAIYVHLNVPQDRWSRGLREVAQRLHQRTVERTPFVDVDLLRPWFSG